MNPRSVVPSRLPETCSARPYFAHVRAPAAPPNFIVTPKQLSMWGNDVHGDCVTAEEAFAKACNNPEIFISDDDVIAWATRHGVLEGAYLYQVMTWMQDDGFLTAPSLMTTAPTVLLTGQTLELFRVPFPRVPSSSASQQTSSMPPGSRQTANPGGSQRDITTTPTRITAPRCAAMDPYPGWHNSLASRCPRESTGRSRAMRCSRGIPLGSSTCPP